MKEDFKNNYKYFLEKWGYDAQSTKCIEEMAELTKAICKYSFKKEKSSEEIKYNILEEIADVLNTVEQLEFYFGEEEIEKIRKSKFDRTIQKIKKLEEK